MRILEVDITAADQKLFDSLDVATPYGVVQGLAQRRCSQTTTAESWRWRTTQGATARRLVDRPSKGSLYGTRPLTEPPGARLASPRIPNVAAGYLAVLKRYAHLSPTFRKSEAEKLQHFWGTRAAPMTAKDAPNKGASQVARY